MIDISSISYFNLNIYLNSIFFNPETYPIHLRQK